MTREQEDGGGWNRDLASSLSLCLQGPKACEVIIVEEEEEEGQDQAQDVGVGVGRINSPFHLHIFSIFPRKRKEERRNNPPSPSSSSS